MEGVISKRIDEIIAKRKEKIPLIEKREQSVRKAIEVVEKIGRFKNSIVDENGNIKPDSKYLGTFSGDMEALQALMSFDGTLFCQRGKALLEAYDELKERFSRDYINIATVGQARQGKSFFIQSVTGLDNRCVPSMAGGHCTGAPSIIENGNNDNVIAEITFKSEREMLEEIQSYLDTVTHGKGKIYSLDDIKNLSDEKLFEWIQPEEKQINKDKIDIIKRRFIQHYNIWRPFVGKDMITESNENVIMEYVAQHNGEFVTDSTGAVVRNPNKTEYWRFPAVKSVRIIKKFRYEDCGKIRLLDTVGLGSTENNVEQNMIDIIKKNCDGAIFFKMPDPNRKGFDDCLLFDIYNRLNREFKNIKPEKWFAYLINRTRKPEDNSIMCESFKEDIKDLPFMSFNIIDASSPEEVINDFLVDFLSQLSQNIDEIDKICFDNTYQKAKETLDECDRLCKKLAKIASANHGSNGDNRAYGKRFDVVYRQLLDRCYKINVQYSEKRNEICEVLYTECKKIMSEIHNLVPGTEKIDEAFSGNMPFQDVYGQCIDIARDRLTKQFLSIDDDLRFMLDGMKTEYANALLNEGRISKILPLKENEDPIVWLKRFEDMLDDKEQANIKYACALLNDFSLSVKSFLMYRIRTSIFPISRTNLNLLAKNVGNNPNDLSKAVKYYMEMELDNIKNILEKALKDFYTAPNEALYGLSDQFYDLIRFSENSEDEWSSIYLDQNNYLKIWSEEISKAARESEVSQEWFELWSSLKEFNKEEILF